MAIMLAVASSMFGFVNSARHVFEVDLERADMQQRARVSMDAFVQRSASWQARGSRFPRLRRFAEATPIRIRRVRRSPIVMSVRYVPPDAAAGEAVTITYALDADAAGVPQLTRYDGRSTDLPLVDQVAALRFEYFDAAGQPIATGAFCRRPWVPDAVAADRFDADLQAIRRVRALVRVRPARTFVGIPLADLEVRPSTCRRGT